MLTTLQAVAMALTLSPPCVAWAWKCHAKGSNSLTVMAKSADPASIHSLQKTAALFGHGRHSASKGHDVAKNKPNTDPRGHSLRIYKDIYLSAAFKSLSPFDVMAYLALLAELKQYNNGDLSLPLTRSKQCGIGHHVTLARSLRALCTVGLVAITRKGGCSKGGKKQATLYRMTDRECYAIPAKFLEAMKATDEWKRITSVEEGRQLIQAADDAVKKDSSKIKSLGHTVTRTRTRRDTVRPNTRTPRDTWGKEPGHGVTMAENPAKPLSMRVSSTSSPPPEKASHRTPRVPPLYVANLGGGYGLADEHGTYRRLTARPANLFTSLIH